MSTIADRHALGSTTSLSDRSQSPAETYFWIGLALVATAMILCAVAGAFYANELPLEASLVGP